MTTNSKKIRFGNVASVSSNKNLPNLRAPKLSFSSFKGSSKDTYKQGSTQTATAPFEISTGITNDSPEIVSFANFVPVYNDSGNLNKAGEIFQAKQDSLLVSANSSITSIISSSVYTQLVESVISNRQNLENFCQYYGESIDDLLKKMSIIKKKLDCRSSLEEQDLISIGISLPAKSEITNQGNSTVDIFPSSIEEIIFENSPNNISKWTPTKTWIQVALELKEFFRNGLPNLLSDSTSPPLSLESNYKSPYNLVLPRSANIKKFGFNETQIIISNYFDNFNVNVDNFESELRNLSSAFNMKKSAFSIFNKSVFSETDSIDKAISRLSHVICKEYVFSTKMNPNVLADYGYTFNTSGAGNQEIWDYFFGQVGSDITDIPTTPLGAGKSLTSLAQYVEADGTEVLAFEDNYIKDNIGTKRPNSTITPGTYYYIESSINTTSNSFDTTRLNSYVTRLKSAVDMLRMLKDNLAFKIDVNPYRTIIQKSASSISSAEAIKSQQQASEETNVGVSNQKNSTDIKSVLSNPILLIREIEQKVLNKSGLLRRKPGPKLWTDRNFFTAQAVDVSALLISSAVEDPELMSLLFLHQIGEINSNKQSQSQLSNNTFSFSTDSAYKERLQQKIIERLLKLYSGKGSENYQNKGKVNSFEIQEALLSEKTAGRQILHDIGKFIGSLALHFEKLEVSNSNFERFFLVGSQQKITLQSNVNNIRDAQTQKKTAYSGIQKTIYLAAIFELCCLMVHAANPERIISTQPGTLDYVIAQVKNAVINDLFLIEEFRAIPGNEDSFPLLYDSIIVNCENSLFDYDRVLLKNINRAYGFIFSLYKELESFSSLLNFNFGKYADFINTMNRLIGDPALTRLLMSEEQMLLIRSKLHDVSNRSSLSYDSEIKRTIPYFLNLKDNIDVDHFLPIEDVHLVSWNLLLKKYLKSTGFRETDGFNKKIISVGIPQRLHRFLRSDASKTKGSARRNKLIKIHIFKVDALKPDLIYEPLTFIFDLNRFPTRILKNYIDSGLTIDGTADLDLNKIPILKSVVSSDISANNSFTIINDQSKSFEDYSFLNQQEKIELVRNHSMSFLMEEYLNYFSGTSFDEQKFSRYDVVKEIIDKEFSKFIGEQTNTQVQSFNSPSIENFFSGETFLCNIENLKKFLITPKKFDRVFHILLDPDDFDIDKDLTEKEIWSNKYGLRDDQSNFGRSLPGSISFDKYYVAIESYDEREPVA
jgi:hypothetical protein